MRIKFLFPILLIGLVMIGAFIGFSRYTGKQELASLYSASFCAAGFIGQ
jgi:hypothetical protein